MLLPPCRVCVRYAVRLFAVEDLDVGFVLAGDGGGNGEGFAVCRDFDFLGVEEFAVHLVGHLERALVDLMRGRGVALRDVWACAGIVLAIEVHAFVYLGGGKEEGNVCVLPGLDFDFEGGVDLLGDAFPGAGEA